MSTPTGSGQAERFSSAQEEAMLTLMRSADCLHREFQRRLKPYGLTAAQFNVLRILRVAHPRGLACSAIGKMMITPEPDITRLIGRLKGLEFVSQQRDDVDRRVIWTHITHQGLEILAKLDGIVAVAPREFLRQLKSSEVAELTRLLSKARFCSPTGSTTEDQHEADPTIAKPPSLRSRLSLLPHRSE